MKKTLLLICAAFLCCAISAQPGWTKKVAKSIFTLKTFNADGTLLSSSNGFFVGQKGEAISNFAPFNGAAKAVIIDAEGRELNVVSIIGANGTYDVVKFRVEAKRTTPLIVLPTAATVGSNVWLVPYSTKKSSKCTNGKIDKVENFHGKYAYYTINMKSEESTVSCPLFNDNGEVIGLLQLPSNETDTICYAVSALFADSLSTNGLSINDATLNSTSIKKELPNSIDQAILTLYMGGSILDSTAYAELIDDFIAKFPNAQDGYIAKAQQLANSNKFEDADLNMAQAIKVADKKDDAHFNYAKLIYHKLVYQNDIPYEKWTLEKAAEEAATAYAINPIPFYKQLEAEVRFTQKKYDEAYNLYQYVLDNDKPNAELYFAAARCKEMLGDSTAVVALLDSAVNTFNKPYLKAAAPYLLARAQALMSVKEYRKAVLDFNDYEKLMSSEINANFYYIRGRAETEGHIYQAALNDYAKAISMEPKNTLYLAEKASLEIRVNLLDDAISTARACIEADANFSEGYLFLGLAQCLKGNKTEGRSNLEKAKDLGDTQAQSLIDKYGK